MEDHLDRIKSDAASRKRTLILLSRQGTQAVVTCLRGALLGFSDSGCIVSGGETLKRGSFLPVRGDWGKESIDSGGKERENHPVIRHPWGSSGSRHARREIQVEFQRERGGMWWW